MIVHVMPPWGEALNDEQAETQWLPSIGPTAFLLHRKLLRLHDQEVTDDALAVTLGVKPEMVRHALKRLDRFGLILLNGTVIVRPWPAPNSRIAGRADERAKQLEQIRA